jgi:hypothetical protein
VKESLDCAPEALSKSEVANAKMRFAVVTQGKTQQKKN